MEDSGAAFSFWIHDVLLSVRQFQWESDGLSVSRNVTFCDLSATDARYSGSFQIPSCT